MEKRGTTDATSLREYQKKKWQPDSEAGFSRVQKGKARQDQQDKPRQEKRREDTDAMHHNKKLPSREAREGRQVKTKKCIPR
mmetsp:Transcript_19112/g.44293  ORF Transcript_19112/g.44293 Transcript_19112/m.44293 type:complete len:82 (+) Transcript_19112:617-862(+)